MNIEKLIVKARALYDLPHGRCKHFTFILKRNKVVSVGWNNTIKTHPMAATYGHKFFAIHSELSALRNFPFPIGELANFDMVNIRIRKDDTLAIAKPCEACERMLVAFRPRSLWFTNNLGNFERYL